MFVGLIGTSPFASPEKRLLVLPGSTLPNAPRYFVGDSILLHACSLALMMSISGGIAFTALCKPSPLPFTKRSAITKPKRTERHCRMRLPSHVAVRNGRVAVRAAGVPTSAPAQPATVGPVLRDRATLPVERANGIAAPESARECLRRRSCRQTDRSRQECRLGSSLSR